MNYHKLLFIGPVGAGKTSAIRSICDENDNLETEAKASDMTSRRKATTTVAMDYGNLTLSDQETIQLYGTPGQSRFKFMWDLLANSLAADCAGIVFLVDNTRNYPMRDLKYYAQEFSELIAKKQVIIAVTRSDLRDNPTVSDYEATLTEIGIDAPVRFIDARKPTSVLPVVEELIADKVEFTDWSTLREKAAEQEKNMPLEEIENYNVVSPEEGGLTINEYAGEEVAMNDAVVDDVMNFKGVKGAALTNDMGDIITSSIESGDVNDFVGFASGVIKVFEDVSDLGKVQCLSLKGGDEDNLSIFVNNDQTLGIQYSSRVSIRALKQQIDDLLQWS